MTKGEAPKVKSKGAEDSQEKLIRTCTTTSCETAFIPGDQEADDSKGSDINNGLFCFVL